MSLVTVSRGVEQAPPGPARHRVDPSTIALWQLNGDGLDSGPNGLDLNENGTVPHVLVGAPGLTAEQAQGQFSDTDYWGKTDAGLIHVGDLTMMCMVRRETLGANPNVILRQGGAGLTEPENTIYRLAIQPDGVVRYRSQDGAANNSDVDSVTTLNQGQWYHVAVVRTTGNVKIYINGTEDVDGAITDPTGGGNSFLRLGRANDANRFYNGYVGSLHVLSRALSGVEILAEANRLLPDWDY